MLRYFRFGPIMVSTPSWYSHIEQSAKGTRTQQIQNLFHGSGSISVDTAHGNIVKTGHNV